MKRRIPMRMRISELRRIIRRVLSEEPGVTADPTVVKGFYDYETERGTDIHSFWSGSPGRAMGTDGDTSRPEDAAAYIGFKTKGATPADAKAEGESEGDEVPSGTDDLSPV